MERDFFVSELAAVGSQEKLDKLLRANKRWNINTSKEEGTALHLAPVANGDVELLIKNGADVNAFDGNGETPIFSAILCLDIDGVKALKKAGADMNHKIIVHENGEEKEVSPFDYADHLMRSHQRDLRDEQGDPEYLKWRIDCYKKIMEVLS